MRILLVIHRYLAVASGPADGAVVPVGRRDDLPAVSRLHDRRAARDARAHCSCTVLPHACRTMRRPVPFVSRCSTAARCCADRAWRRSTSRRRATARLDAGRSAAGRQRYARRRGVAASPRWLRQVQLDQWSIQSAARNQPAHQVALGDAAGPSWPSTARPARSSSRPSAARRVLSWFGAIPHGCIQPPCVATPRCGRRS